MLCVNSCVKIAGYGGGSYERLLHARRTWLWKQNSIHSRQLLALAADVQVQFSNSVVDARRLAFGVDKRSGREGAGGSA
eukprot:1378845-Pleurochrysis_carterae.AAC.2